MPVKEAMRRAVVAPKPWGVQLALALGFVAAAAGSRWLLDRGANGVPFASFLPFIVLAAIVLDLRYAVLVVCLSTVVAANLFLRWGDPTVARLFLLGAFLLTAVMILAVGCNLRRMIIELDGQARQFAMFNTELQHRMKNTLQMISAMASAGKSGTDPDLFYKELTGRIHAINRANQFLGITRHQQGAVADLVAIAIQPFRSRSLYSAGPFCLVDGECGLRLMIVLHELCTNATKYGALSVPQGRVDIAWEVLGTGLARLEWREHDGPVVAPPRRRGLGTRLFVKAGPIRKVAIRYHPAGVQCSIEFCATTAS